MSPKVSAWLTLLPPVLATCWSYRPLATTLPPGGGPQMAAEWWVAPLHPAMYPPEERRRKPSFAKQCPKFGIDSVLVRPDGDPADDTNVRPGAHGFGEEGKAYSVVWWDSHVLELGKTPSFSLRHETTQDCRLSHDHTRTPGRDSSFGGISI